MQEYEIVTLVDSHHGQYIPQIFAQTVNKSLCKGVPDTDWDILERGLSLDNEFYWDTMIDAETNCEIHDSNGKVWTLYYNGDLFAVTGNVPEEFYER